MPEGVTFKSDGFNIAGLLYLPRDGGFGSPYPCVILCHGIAGRKEGQAPIAEMLRGDGFACLSFDFRGHGQSEGQLDPSTPHDITAAVKYLEGRKEIDANRLAIRGFSMGGFFALYVAAGLQQIKAIVSVAPGTESAHLAIVTSKRFLRYIEEASGRVRLAVEDMVSFLRKVSICAEVARISPRSLLIIHSKEDEMLPWHSSEEIFFAAKEPSRFLLLNGGEHSATENSNEVHRLVLAWLKEQLAPCGT
ncbi:MAG: alpha/beta fold hydrolase [Chloroflexi bacterium]|nr:alpha/beta fold hydrolase [Chloroflexota bacterium]